MVNLFQTGTFTLASGAMSWWKIECDTLSDTDWTTLASLIAERVGKFSEVHGVPRGGLKLAEALRFHRWTPGYPILIVDDVWTTGGSFMRELGKIGDQWAHIGYKGAVVFARDTPPPWVMPLFQLNLTLAPRVGR